MAPAPIIVFAYNRPAHLQRTLKALAANELAAKSPLTIYCDGPKNVPDPAVDATRYVARQAKGFASVTVIEHENNRGLASSIIHGVTSTLNEFGVAIIVEDDLIVSPHFLSYLNTGLVTYKNNEKVASIHGWLFPHSLSEVPETFFLRGADCWGWATWKRAWDFFEPNALKLMDELRKRSLVEWFNGYGAYPYFEMLEQVAAQRVNSWAVRWLASTVLADMYTLYPGRTLVQNIGFDGTGTHCGNDALLISELSMTPVQIDSIPIEDHALMRWALNDFNKSLSGGKGADAKKSKPPKLAKLRKSIWKRLEWFGIKKEKDSQLYKK